MNYCRHLPSNGKPPAQFHAAEVTSVRVSHLFLCRDHTMHVALQLASFPHLAMEALPS